MYKSPFSLFSINVLRFILYLVGIESLLTSKPFAIIRCPDDNIFVLGFIIKGSMLNVEPASLSPLLVCILYNSHRHHYSK